MVRPKILQSLSQGPTKLQHSKEFLEKENSSIVRQTAIITGDFDISRQTHHFRPLLTNS
jgi:hypothetical protein